MLLIFCLRMAEVVGRRETGRLGRYVHFVNTTSVPAPFLRVSPDVARLEAWRRMRCRRVQSRAGFPQIAAESTRYAGSISGGGGWYPFGSRVAQAGSLG